MAPAKVLQGAVREHGLASSPTPDTQVRVACACASEGITSVRTRTASALKFERNLFMGTLLLRGIGIRWFISCTDRYDFRNNVPERKDVSSFLSLLSQPSLGQWVDVTASP